MENSTEMEIDHTPKGFAMTEGDGPHSYVRNSNLQGAVIKASKQVLVDAITKEFDTRKFSPFSTAICVADLGCSTGSNTVLAVENIVEAIQRMYEEEEEDGQVPEFQVLFNDHATNDFNTLFKILPPSKRYFAAGVPGSFYGRLFPRKTVHFFHSSSALQWLSQAPKPIMDKNSNAWNKGRIFYTAAPKAVVDAYAVQYAADMECFLRARSEEVVPGGLMALFIPACDDDIYKSEDGGSELDLVGTCLMDMAKLGLVSEEKVDSFNVPMYFPSFSELKEIIEKNEQFSMQSFEKFKPPMGDLVTSHVNKELMIQMKTAGFRAGIEGLIKEQFGSEMLEEFFHRLAKKIAVSPDFLNPEKNGYFMAFALLKGKENILISDSKQQNPISILNS